MVRVADDKNITLSKDLLDIGHRFDATAYNKPLSGKELDGADSLINFVRHSGWTSD